MLLYYIGMSETNQNEESGKMKRAQIQELQIMDLGRYLIGNNIQSETGRGMIATPERYGRHNMAVMAISLSDANARRMAKRLAAQV